MTESEIKNLEGRIEKLSEIERAEAEQQEVARIQALVKAMTSEEQLELARIVVDIERLQALNGKLSVEEKAKLSHHESRFRELQDVAAGRLTPTSD